ncbi:MAG: hypothetical protein QG675_535 [Patescibacteria group bacterium]|jgi:hypothetical protein|nr:hypothetical protein [Patescibacteria group bacterium]
MNIFQKLKKDLKDQNFFRDSWLVVLLIITLIGNVFIIVWSATHIKNIGIDIPVRFTSLSNFDQLGVWYSLYEIAVISVIITIINLFLAIILHKKNRILSIFLTITTLMIVILAIAILLGFTVIKYGAN